MVLPAPFSHEKLLTRPRAADTFSDKPFPPFDVRQINTPAHKDAGRTSVVSKAKEIAND
jgi:hypothetical protein